MDRIHDRFFNALESVIIKKQDRYCSANVLDEFYYFPQKQIKNCEKCNFQSVSPYKEKDNLQRCNLFRQTEVAD